MLGYFIKINNEQMPNPAPGSFVFKLNPDENVFANEAGGQMVNVKRLNRPTWSATFNCSSRMRDKLLAFCQLAQCTTHIDGVEYTGRLRLSGDVALYEWSEYTKNTKGLWTVPVVFEGF